MNGTFCFLKIEAPEQLYSIISELLGVVLQDYARGWMYEVELGENTYSDAINFLLDLLECQLPTLENIGIHRHCISVSLIYSYRNQCNLEFLPIDLKRLGDSGIALCVSCYENGN